MNELARRFGVTGDLSFYDVYSLYDSDALSIVPRPVYALLTTIPMTPAWEQSRDTEDANLTWYTGSGPDEPAVWFQQTVIHGCGLIGLLHCVSNGEPSKMIRPDTILADFLHRAIPMGMDDRARLLSLNETKSMWEASEAVARKGDTRPVLPVENTGNHFVTFVKCSDGNLWELEGARKGPINRGRLAEHEDAFSERALDIGIRRLIDICDNVNFSCLALARTMD